MKIKSYCVPASQDKDNQHEITDLLQEVKKRKIPYNHHESDLYIPITPETKNLIERYKYKACVNTFVDNIDHKPCFDIFAAYYEEKGLD